MNNNRNQGSGYRYQNGVPRQGQPNYNASPNVNRQTPANQSRSAGMQNPNANLNMNRAASGTAPRQNPQKTAAHNQQTAKKQRLQFTPEQIEINKANRMRELYYLKKQRAQARKTFVSRLMLFIAVVIVMGLLVLGIFWLNLTYADTDSESRYTYVIGEDKYKLDYSRAVRDGRVYVSFTDVASLCDFAVTGSPENMSFIIKGNEDTETIRFLDGSRAAFVNGIETRLGAASVYEDGEVYVPVEFVSAYMKGVTVEVNERSHEVNIQRVITNLNEDGKLPKGEEAIYMEPSFLLQSASGLRPLNEDELADVAALPDLGFATNLSIYESYMNPGNITDYLTLVSIKYQLSPDFAPQDLMGLVDTRDDGRTVQQLRENAAWSMEAMFKELRAAGFDDVDITSAYRPYSYQEYIFNQYLAQHNYDYDYVATFSNPPGSSEHQLGLCADLHNLPSADISFAETEAFMWLRDNCWKFGFILRYPEDKVDITGISYEPWHYRYVGRYHAQRIYDERLCLEEYLEKYYPELISETDVNTDTSSAQ